MPVSRGRQSVVWFSRVRLGGLSEDVGAGSPTSRFTVGQVAWRLGITPDENRALEAGEPIHDFETWDRICKLYGWSETFVIGGTLR
jgi:hypothetical protein